MNRQKREEATTWLPNVGGKVAVDLTTHDGTLTTLSAVVEQVNNSNIVTTHGGFSRFTHERSAPRYRSPHSSVETIRQWSRADEEQMEWFAARNELNAALRALYDSTNEGAAAVNIRYLAARIKAMVSK